MLVLGLQGSPRIGGNTDALLTAFLERASEMGAETTRIDVAEMSISPCIGCRSCERTGFCPIDDETPEVFFLIRRADLVVLASPVYFFGVTAFMKALIDRCQVFWSRKYIHKLKDPGDGVRKGIYLSVGGSKGENLFDGLKLTAKYFFVAIGASFEGGLGFRKIEAIGDIERHPTAINEVKERAGELVAPLIERKHILFLCRENACRSQMAWAFARSLGGEKIEVMSAGDRPAKEINPRMVEVMTDRGIDMAFIRPKTINEAIEAGNPDIIVSMGCEVSCPNLTVAKTIDWDIPDPVEGPIELMRRTADDIEGRVRELIDKYT